MITKTARDVHPPLYYILLKPATCFPFHSLIIYRIITAMASWLNLLLLGATVIRRRWGNTSAVLYIMFFGGLNETFVMTSRIRMYSWSAFFVTAAVLFLIICVKNDDIVWIDDCREHNIVYEYYMPETDVTMLDEMMTKDGTLEVPKESSGLEGKKIWYFVNYTLPHYGAQSVEEDVSKYDLVMNPVGNYTLECKYIEVYCITEKEQ